MIEDIYQHSDLLKIANCRHKAKLRKWLTEQHIPFLPDTKGGFIASKKVVDSKLGYDLHENKVPKVDLWLGDESAT